MMDKTQYIETLIKLVELNSDETWTLTFKNLRNGGYLPGGGAGSLNDWGPSYTDKLQHDWYSHFYRIMRYLYDKNLRPESLKDFKSIANSHKIQVLRCVDCNGRYQHPSVFESHIALDFYTKRTADYYNKGQLIKILEPIESYGSPTINFYRDWLNGEYKRLGIEIYDFVRAKYVCPHCGRQHSETQHDLYKIEKKLFGKMKIRHLKDNASWNDFE
ncbi:hypothetical protein [Geofilum rhodophaeum]|uniref:hypothetical protein n=1 Tax=Geofilum rhodophaeum TaxID=1965019 RepID=UPI000B51F9DD|nr:hypothetical protein [Geofilum rhodophaeum]